MILVAISITTMVATTITATITSTTPKLLMSQRLVIFFIRFFATAFPSLLHNGHPGYFWSFS